MRFLLKGLLPLIVFSVFLTSCGKDEDNESPQIIVISPQNNAHFEPGEYFHVIVDFTDNIELSSWKIDIHDNQDGHGHKKAQAWSVVKTGVLSGKEDSIDILINIPEDAEHGDYDLLVFAIDAAGNESFREIDFHIEEDHD